MVSATAATTIAMRGFERVKELVGAAARWWLVEMRASLPRFLRSHFELNERPLVILERQNDGFVGCRLMLNERYQELGRPLHECTDGAIRDWLLTHNLRREDVRLAVKLWASECLQRDVMLPRAALNAIDTILEQDIEHRTPFELDQIWHGAAQNSATDDPIAIKHWIVRRDRAHAVISQTGLDEEAIDALIVAGADGENEAFISLRKVERYEFGWARRAIWWLSSSAIALLVAGVASVLIAESLTLAQIEDAIVNLHAEHGSIANGNRAARLRAMKAAPGAIDVWEELSRVIPTHTFVTDLRIADDAVSISGFSADAAHLVRLIDVSPLFTAARLTSAIIPDVNEKRDRFSLEFRLRHVGAATEPNTNSIAQGEFR